MDKDTFLTALRGVPNIKRACRLVGCSRQNAYYHKAHDPEFAAEWDDAIDEGVDHLEERARHLAEAGNPSLLMFMLRAQRPSVYREPSAAGNRELTEVVRETLGTVFRMFEETLPTETRWELEKLVLHALTSGA